MEDERLFWALQWLGLFPTRSPKTDAIERLLDGGKSLEEIKYMLTGSIHDHQMIRLKRTRPPTFTREQ